MIKKKSLLSVAAAVAISSSMISADYLPLTSTTADDKWVMFGVAGFHANGATAGTGTTGATEAGQFSVPDDAINVAIDTDGNDELYGTDVIGTTANPLGSVKRIDGVSSDVEVRVNVGAIAYQETDPVRTIYVTDKENGTPIFAFSYKSALEGEKLEFSTTATAENDNAYFITINSENTYNNPAVGVFIPSNDGTVGEGASDGTPLKEIANAVDFDFEDNPLKSSNYLQVDDQTDATGDDSFKLYSYNTNGVWEIYDSRNSFKDFTDFQKGKGYWGKMDLTDKITADGSSVPAGFVLGAPSISTQDYIDSGIAEGWNLLAFNAGNADLRAATTGLIVTIAAAAEITLTDASGNHKVAHILTSTTADIAAREINYVVKLAKIEGKIPKTFNIVAIPLGLTDVALLSNEKFSLGETADGTLGSVTTLTGATPLNASTLVTHTTPADLTGVNAAMSKYGEYALVVKPENASYARLSIKCGPTPEDAIVPNQAGIEGAVCIQKAYDLDTDYDGTANNHILMASTAPFEVRDHTFTRVFDFTASANAGTLTFANADTGILTTTIPAAVPEIFTADFSAVDDGDSVAFDGVTYTAAGGDGATATDAAAAFVAVHNGNGTNWTSSALAGTVTFTAINVGDVDPDILAGDFTITDADITTAEAITGVTVTQPGVGATAADIVATLSAAANGLVVNEEIVAVGEKIVFRMTENPEYQILETGLADNLTPSSTSDVSAKGAISHVFSPNHLVKAALENSIEIGLDNTAPTHPSTVSVTMTVPLVGAVPLADYTVITADTTDSVAFYERLATHINNDLRTKGIDTTVAIVKVDPAALNFAATVTFTGSDATDATIAFSTGGPAVTAAAAPGTLILGTPKIVDGDMTQDLKYNYVLSPNYVLDGPLYEMHAAGFKPLAMVTGTMNNAGTAMGWDGIDLTRKPSEWLDSQDYNLFTVDSQAGYWTYLETAGDNPLSFSSNGFSAQYTQHFDHDGKTFNEVTGNIEITVDNIDDYDDRKSARVVAIVRGFEVELSADTGSNVYTGKISSREVNELIAGGEYDINVVVADGLGNRIPSTRTGEVVDFEQPSKPTVSFVDGSTIAIANPANEGVTKYYIFDGTIPANNTENAKEFVISAAEANAYNICSQLGSRTSTYDLKIVALDGENLATSNASDAFLQDNYMPLFKNSAIVSNTNQGDGTATTSTATVKYTNTCVADETFTGDASVQASSLTDLKTVKVAYEQKVVGTAVPVTAYVYGGSANPILGRITYHPDYDTDTVFIQLGTQVYSYALTEADSLTSTETSPIDLSTAGTPLPGQSLGE